MHLTEKTTCMIAYKTSRHRSNLDVRHKHSQGLMYSLSDQNKTFPTIKIHDTIFGVFPMLSRLADSFTRSK